MEVIIFGHKLTISNEHETPLLWNAKTVATVTLHNNKLTISFTGNVSFKSPNKEFNVIIDTGTVFNLDIATKTGTITGAPKITIYELAPKGMTLILSEMNEVRILFNVSDTFNQLAYDNIISNHFTKFQTVFPVGINDRLPVQSFSLNLHDNCMDLFLREDLSFQHLDTILIKENPKERLSFKQDMIINRVRIPTDGGAQIYLDPEFKYLPVFPDVLSMNPESAKNKKELQIKYQFALANGLFCFEKKPGQYGLASWRKPLFNEDEPVLILSNITDSNSYPTAIKTKFNIFQLDFRVGLSSLTDSTPVNYAEKTIRGLSVSELNDATIYQLSAKTIDWEKKERQIYGVGLTAANNPETLTAPFWLPANGIVKTETSSPDNLYSLVKGAWLQAKNDPRPLNCKLRSKPVELDGEQIYHLITLELDSSQWDLYSQYEERESHVASKTTSAVFHIDSRKFVAQAPTTLALPATDYLLGGTNITDPKGRKASIIPVNIQHTIDTINDTFTNYSADVAAQEHIQGFTRNYKDSTQKIIADTVFLYPPPKAGSIEDTLPAPIQLRPGAVSFNHGDYKNSTKAVLPAAAPVDIMDDGQVQNYVNQLHHLWNDYLFLAESTTDTALKKAALAIQQIRIYLENLKDEQAIDTLRVRYRNEVYYRLQLNRIAPNDASKEILLHQVKFFVKGNLNAIPGLGKRLKAVQQQIEEMTVAKFTTAWNLGWDTLTKETDKILYALFDTVYKQFDRSVLNKLLEIILSTSAALEDIRKQARIIFDYLKLSSDDVIKQFKNNLEQEITELISTVTEGVDPYVDDLRNIWNNATTGCDDVSLDTMKAVYGARFGINTFNSLLKDLKSDHSDLKEQAGRIIKCLERKLRQEIRKRLLDEWNQLTTATWQQIEKWLKDKFDAYQEDIWNFYTFIVQIEQAYTRLQQYLTLIKKISQVKNAQDLIRLKNEPGFKEIYNEASSIILKEYGDDIKKLEAIPAAEFEKLVNKYWEEIVFVVSTLQQLIDEYNFWKDIILKLKTAIEDVRFTITQFITDLQDDAKRRAMLRLLVSYLVEKYNVNLSIPDLRVEPPQYIIYSKHLSFNTPPAFKKQMEDLLKKLHLQKLVLCNLGGGKQWHHSFSESSVYILKLGNDLNMPGILREVNNNNKKPGLENGPFNDQAPDKVTPSPLEQLITDLHPDLRDEKWRGIFIYKPFADIREDGLLRDLMGKSSLQMSFAAIGGTTYDTDNAKLDIPFNIYARVKENADKMDIDLGNKEQRPDSLLTLVKFDALIKNTRLEQGDAILQLDFQNVFSKEYKKDEQIIMIRGTLPAKSPGDNSPRDFEFGVTFQEKDGKVLDDLPGFLDTLQLRGIRATRQAGRSVLEIDATLKFKKFEAIANVGQLALKNFYIILPSSDDGTDNPAGKPRGVNFDIGAIEFIIDKPRPISFSGIELLPKGIGYIKKYEGTLAENFDRNVIWINGQPPEKDSFTYLKLDIQFGKLPSLGGVNIKDLRFEGVIGVKVKESKPDPKVYFGLISLSGKEISIDLFRFISIYINELLVCNASIGSGGAAANVTFIGAKKIDFKILDWSPLGKNSNFSLAFIHNRPPENSTAWKASPQQAMVAAYSNAGGQNLGIIKLYWILLAHNLQFAPDVLNGLLSPSSVASTDPVNKIMDRIFQGIQDSNEDHSFEDISFSSNPGWLFGASFSIAGILDRCSFVLHDQYYYGIMLSSTHGWFRELFGTDTLSLAYIPGKTKELDRFRIEMKLPFLDLIGPMQAGLVALEYGLNRDFLVDFGFPWKDGNTYLWHRTFSFAAGIYETRFGFYFEKRTDITVTGDKEVTIGAGVAFSYGYKVGARSPFAWAEAGISVTVILMGSVTFRFQNGGSDISLLKGTLSRIEVIGVIGIYAYARGGVDYWVFSAEIKAEVVAALAGHLIYLPAGNSSLTFTATLSVRYSARARIKAGFFSITVSISGSLSYGVSGRIGLN